MPSEYAVFHHERLVVAGPVELIAEKLNVTPEQVELMATEEWREKYPIALRAYPLRGSSVKVKPNKPSYEGDLKIKEMYDLGMSMADIGSCLGISETSVRNAYMRITSGRWG